jgi:hypothetical protein
MVATAAGGGLCSNMRGRVMAWLNDSADSVQKNLGIGWRTFRVPSRALYPGASPAGLVESGSSAQRQHRTLGRTPVCPEPQLGSSFSLLRQIHAWLTWPLHFCLGASAQHPFSLDL